MNRFFLFALSLLLLTLSCRKNIDLYPPKLGKPCIRQFNLPDSVGTWHIDTFPLPKNDRYNRDLFFVNDKIGFLLKDYYSLFKTTDGGKTWAQLPNFKSYDIAEQVYFVNENIGFVSIFGRPNAPLMVTTDGGNTWKNQLLNLNGTLSHFQFVDNTHGFALLFGLTLTTTTYKLNIALVETKNQGQTWAEVPLTDSLSTDRLGLQFLDNKKAFAIAQKNRTNYLIKSLDGGVTWKALGNLPNDILSFKFVDEQNGIATNFSNCFTTTDGGLTWQQKTDIDGLSRLLFVGSLDDILMSLETTQCDFGDYIQPQSQFLSIENNNILRAPNVSLSSPRLSFFLNNKLGYAVLTDRLLRFTR